MSRNCRKCSFFYEEYAGYEEGGHLEERGCRKRPNVGNLKSFPFNKDQKCFQLGFWFSEFAEQLKDGSEEEMDRMLDAYRKKYVENVSEKAQP